MFLWQRKELTYHFCLFLVNLQGRIDEINNKYIKELEGEFLEAINVMAVIIYILLDIKILRGI